MSRVIEIALFLLPFAAFLAWRLWAPAARPPSWLLGVLFAGVLFAGVLLLLGGLIVLRQGDARDASRPYVPAALQDGRVVRGTP